LILAGATSSWRAASALVTSFCPAVPAGSGAAFAFGGGEGFWGARGFPAFRLAGAFLAFERAGFARPLKPLTP
jgi:hypothetical protein